MVMESHLSGFEMPPVKALRSILLTMGLHSFSCPRLNRRHYASGAGLVIMRPSESGAFGPRPSGATEIRWGAEQEGPKSDSHEIARWIFTCRGARSLPLDSDWTTGPESLHRARGAGHGCSVPFPFGWPRGSG